LPQSNLDAGKFPQGRKVDDGPKIPTKEGPFLSRFPPTKPKKDTQAKIQLSLFSFGLWDVKGPRPPKKRRAANSPLEPEKVVQGGVPRPKGKGVAQRNFFAGGANGGPPFSMKQSKGISEGSFQKRYRAKDIGRVEGFLPAKEKFIKFFLF